MKSCSCADAQDAHADAHEAVHMREYANGFQSLHDKQDLMVRGCGIC